MPIPLNPPSSDYSGSILNPDYLGIYPVPLGIECPIERNGFRFNNKNQNEYVRIMSIDGLDDADIRSTVEPNPSDHGEILFDSPKYGGRTLVLNCRVIAQSLSSMRILKRAACRSFNDLKEYPMIWRTGSLDTDHQINCRKVSIAGSEAQSNMKLERDFQITVRAQNPRFVSRIEYVRTINLYEETQITIPNLGDFPSTCRVQIIGPIGDGNISFTNLTTNERVHIGGSIDVDDVYFFNMERLGLRVTDLAGNNKYNDLYDDARRIVLVPGNNNISMDSPLGSFLPNSMMMVYWRNSWL